MEDSIITPGVPTRTYRFLSLEEVANNFAYDNNLVGGGVVTRVSNTRLLVCWDWGNHFLLENEGGIDRHHVWEKYKLSGTVAGEERVELSGLVRYDTRESARDDDPETQRLDSNDELYFLGILPTK